MSGNQSIVGLGMVVWVGINVGEGSEGVGSVRQADKNRHSKNTTMCLKTRFIQDRAILPELIKNQKVYLMRG